MAKKFSTPQMLEFLEHKVDLYNRPEFIVSDPICIPHSFKKTQDIEIAGLFAAVLAWGQRVTIIRKCRELMAMMDDSPFDFVLNHKLADLKRFDVFKHRTFNPTDTVYFIHFLRHHYQRHQSLAQAFDVKGNDEHIGNGLINFQNYFFSLEDSPARTRKHIPTPERKSTCKRLSMYLRWMVRDDKKGVDFGLWKSIRMDQLICPCDLHVDRVARLLRLIKRKQTDWQTAVELTTNLKKFDAVDPVKYDFALFGLGIEEKWK